MEARLKKIEIRHVPTPEAMKTGRNLFAADMFIRYSYGVTVYDLLRKDVMICYRDSL